MADRPVPYRGRLAPSPTGLLHLGHARTFALAHARARRMDGGTLVLRLEDLDRARCREEFVAAIFEDLRWAGMRWEEGPDVGGPHAPYRQSARGSLYREALRRLATAGWLYPCTCSRQDIARALSAPHPEDRGPLYPGTCRPPEPTACADPATAGVNWRFRVPADTTVGFTDGRLGPQRQVGGRGFGDFVVWRRDGFAAYELAVVVDDAAMGITEVVRGEDLLPSTGQQLLLYAALGHVVPPHFFHAALVRDGTGRRLAKRDAAHSLRALRESGIPPGALATLAAGEG